MKHRQTAPSGSGEADKRAGSAEIVYRKIAGRWRVYGPFFDLDVRGGTVKVRRRDGCFDNIRVFDLQHADTVDGIRMGHARAEQRLKCASCGRYHFRSDIDTVAIEYEFAIWDRESGYCDCWNRLAAIEHRKREAAKAADEQAAAREFALEEAQARAEAEGLMAEYREEME